MSRRPVITNDAVVRDTPARWATSINVTLGVVTPGATALGALDDQPLGGAGDVVGDDLVHGDAPAGDRDAGLAGGHEDAGQAAPPSLEVELQADRSSCPARSPCRPCSPSSRRRSGWRRWGRPDRPGATQVAQLGAGAHGGLGELGVVGDEVVGVRSRRPARARLPGRTSLLARTRAASRLRVRCRSAACPARPQSPPGVRRRPGRQGRARAHGRGRCCPPGSSRSPRPPDRAHSALAKKLSSENLDELLQLWWTEQGVAKRRDVELMAAALPFPTETNLRVLDMCCGPGDVGRSIWGRYRNSRIDCVDRDVFLICICDGINRREGVYAENFVRDLWNSDRHTACATTMTQWRPRTHFTGSTHRVLWSCSMISSGCFVPVECFLFVEPACAEKTFAAGFAEWKSRQRDRYSRENWERFRTRANEILGYDHTKFLGSRDSNRISDEMPVSGWILLSKNAGFDSIDVLLRDADEVILASSKAANAPQPSG